MRRYVWISAAVLCIASFGWTLARLAPPRQPLEPGDLQAKAGEVRGIDTGGTGSPVPGSVLLRGATLVTQRVDGAGQAVGTRTEDLPEELVGRTFEDVQRMRPEWFIREFAPGRLVVEERTCSPADTSGRYLGISDGRVAVFSGRPGPCGRVTQMTDILVGQLPDFQQAELQHGIAFVDERELSLILEGLSEGP